MLYENNIAKNSDFVKIFDYSLQKPQAENTKASQNAPTKAKCFVGALFTCKIPSAYAAFRYSTLCPNQTPSLALLSISLSVKLWVAV